MEHNTRPGVGSKPFVFDGAFGTYYHRITGGASPCEAANLRDPETVYRIHREYIEAGADAIKTNTYGANRQNFPEPGLCGDIIREGFAIACRAARGTSAQVFADIGYFAENDAKSPEALSEESADPFPADGADLPDAACCPREEYLSTVREFAKAGATRFLFETFAEYDPILPAAAWIKKNLPDSFVIVSFAVSQDGYTRKGLHYKTLLKRAAENPDIDACGLNCVCGPSHIETLLKEIQPIGKPLCAMPNSGYPATVGGRTVFRDNAEYFADKLLELYQSGITILGGCCGTTPEHIRRAIKRLASAETAVEKASAAAPKTIAGTDGAAVSYADGVQPAGKKQQEGPMSGGPLTPRTNRFRETLASGRKIIAVELDPPMDADVTFLLEASRKARDAGADIVTLADSPLARTRADSMLLAAKIKREVGVDVLPHLSCRDRNHIGIKAALLGASIENVDNVLIVTGDPIAPTDRAEQKGVFSYNSFQLISFVKSLNEEVFRHAPFTVAAALNINSGRFENELKRAREKIERGAELFLTQPMFSEESVQNALEARKSLSAKILFGILPVVSYRNAMFLNNEVSGIRIPEDFIAQLADKTPDETRELSLRFCMGLVEKTRCATDGYYLMTPLRKIDLICDLIRRIRLLQ